jgi:hypothetical protein
VLPLILDLYVEANNEQVQILVEDLAVGVVGSNNMATLTKDVQAKRTRPPLP